MTDFAEAFANIADTITGLWDRSDPHHLVNAAVAGLRATDLSVIDPASCLEWAVGSSALPEQSWDFDFGQPAITVARTSDFRIDLLYWMENVAGAHDHMTCGAFAALHGDRVHTEYEFVESKVFDENLAGGTLTRTGLEIMRTGEVRPITPELIHDIYWIQKPAVTLVVRCESHPGPRRTPREYWLPGLAYVVTRHQKASLVRRQSEAISLLRKSSPRRYQRVLAEVLQRGTAALAYRAYLDAAISAPDVLDEVLDQIPDNDVLIPLLDDCRPEFVRRSLLGGVFVRDRAVQTLTALRWAGASGADLHALLSPEDRDGRSLADLIEHAAAYLKPLSPEAAVLLNATTQGPQ
ncbi:hypothetical protein MSIMFI_02601 [Mycobacterium simulans]|uniref:hypothetical protein n=1 Tax=Mycobacterium simulans TaxID=627089 RepID=UPI00174C0063|nr:hypothetical protein [Mycobacterium simulans]SON61096.1 hypothetical protein MSIMFI_02601 [Mycobacterium simulans]